MAEIVWTDEAVRHLEQIRAYISKDNPDAAHKTVSGIYGKVQILKEQIRIGHLMDHNSTAEIRELLYGHYRIPYFIESKDRLFILGIYHSAMDIDRILADWDDLGP